MQLEFIPRKLAFEHCPQLAQHLMSWQKAMFTPSDDKLYAGDKVYLEGDDETPSVLTQDQADSLNDEHSKYCLEMCDKFEAAPAQKEFHSGVVAELDVSSFEAFIENIGNRLNQLSLELGWDSIMVISNTRTPYLGQENSYQPVKMAFEKLIALGMTRTSTQAVLLNRNTAVEFFGSIFWIVRGNISTPEISFTSKNSHIIGTLCKHGNIHFDCYEKSAAVLLLKALSKANFVKVPNGICEERFSKSSRIEARKLKLD